MFAGIVLLLFALVLFGIGAILPKVNAQLAETLNAIPKGMQAFAASLSPQAAFAMKIQKILPRIALGCFAAGGVALVVAIAAFVIHPTPLLLTIFAWIALIVTIVGGTGLALALKKFGGMASQMAGGLRR